MRPFRLAFVGVDHPHGAGWRELLPALHDEIELTATVPRFGGSLTSLEERYAHLPRFGTVQELVAADVCDGAIVCLPNSEASAAVATLAKSGRHVLLEKPGAASAIDFEPAAEAIREKGVAFQSGYMWRYDAGAERLKAMLAEKRFGQLISIEAGLFTSDVARRGSGHYLFDPAQSRRGFFNWLACHWFDLLLFLIDEPIVAVTARVGRFGATPVEVEDGGAAILELAGGALVTFTGGYWLPRWTGESRWTIRGSQRWVHWEPSKPGTGGAFAIHGPQPQFIAMEETFTLPPDSTPGYGGARSHRLIRDWLHDARTGERTCRNTVESALATLQLLDAIYEASDAGRRIVANPR